MRASFTRHGELQPVSPLVTDYNMVKLGFPESLASQAVLITIPKMNIGGMSGVGSRVSSTGFKFISYNYDAIVSLDKISGRHRMKMGFEYQKHFINMGQPVAPSGQYNFDTTANSSKTRAGNGYAYAAFLIGMGQENTPANAFTIDPFIAQSNPYYGLYFQDNFRLTTKLTLDFGVRWEIFGGRTERYDRHTYFDPNLAYTVAGIAMKGGLVFVKDNQSTFDTNLRDIGPRLGIAYRLTERTVLHAGGGIFFGPSAQAVANAGTNTDGFASRTRWNAVTADSFGNTVMLNPLRNPFPNGVTPLNGEPAGSGHQPGRQPGERAALAAHTERLQLEPRAAARAARRLGGLRRVRGQPRPSPARQLRRQRVVHRNHRPIPRRSQRNRAVPVHRCHHRTGVAVLQQAHRRPLADARGLPAIRHREPLRWRYHQLRAHRRFELSLLPVARREAAEQPSIAAGIVYGR